ncbi:hypothetical protein PoB_005651400 [Plakobranchus ocellatus]|uniref:Uncharacterized protein n=1 Tax=Plakobranchus ocellatus TaxID=259542 RepID=A0AAV4CFR1_9GAST|nr:hypothetical protein PoB_005651400 [Plakobranchus ocellatus]
MHDKIRKLLLATGTAILGIGFLLHSIALCTPGWMVKKSRSSENLGDGTSIFKLCDKSWPCDVKDTTPAQLIAAQAFSCLGFIFGALALTLALRHLVRSFRWELPDPDIVVNMILMASLASGTLSGTDIGDHVPPLIPILN